MHTREKRIARGEGRTAAARGSERGETRAARRAARRAAGVGGVAAGAIHRAQTVGRWSANEQATKRPQGRCAVRDGQATKRPLCCALCCAAREALCCASSRRVRSPARVSKRSAGLADWPARKSRTHLVKAEGKQSGRRGKRQRSARSGQQKHNRRAPL